MLRPSGISHFKITDIRGSRKGAVKHLVELPADQAKMMLLGIHTGALSNRRRSTSTSWIESEGCRVCNTI
ncbi:MAG: hypothetical protein QXK96_03550, partial [Candidatus Bathyarchaeia archaeon]